ncbi:MAG: hypothetical protein HY275_05290 [Gemmatimonadetes bacterium]|nr:hypothetical protein [Gemmatimonadota bacterium]
MDLYFNQWRQVEDPKRLLQGTGKAVRFLTLESARRVSHPDVEALIASAVAGAKVPLARDGRGRLVFRTGAGSAKGKRTKKG